jgi:hypothetical protein
MVFNATFNNISVISWRSVLLVDKNIPLLKHWGRRGGDRMVAGFTTTYPISVYHH